MITMAICSSGGNGGEGVEDRLTGVVGGCGGGGRSSYEHTGQNERERKKKIPTSVSGRVLGKGGGRGWKAPVRVKHRERTHVLRRGGGDGGELGTKETEGPRSVAFI